MKLSEILGLRAQHTDTTVLDVVELALLVGDEIPRHVTFEELQARWGVSYGSVSWRMSRLKRAGLVEYDRGVRERPGYWLWQIGPREDL